MDLASFSQLARSQGPIFWVATAAIALGATLLVVALVQQLRRVIAARAGAADIRIIDTAPATEAPDVYEAPQPTLAAAPPRPPARPEQTLEDPGDYSLALLLRRLQSTGDRLEELAGDLSGENPLADDSGLKEDLQDVEYVFRASGP